MTGYYLIPFLLTIVTAGLLVVGSDALGIQQAIGANLLFSLENPYGLIVHLAAGSSLIAALLSIKLIRSAQLEAVKLAAKQADSAKQAQSQLSEVRKSLAEAEAEQATSSRRIEELNTKLNQGAEERQRAEKTYQTSIEQLKTALTEAQTRLKDHELRLNQAAKAAEHSPDRSSAELIAFLGSLQDKGRFIDFLKEDIATHADQQVAQVARFVHQGCKDVLDRHLDIQPIESGKEGQNVDIQADYNPLTHRVVGAVKDQGSMSGRIRHRGWYARSIELPDIQLNTQLDVQFPQEEQAGQAEGLEKLAGIKPHRVISPSQVEV